MIIFATDRMLTAGDVQFEPIGAPNKVTFVTNSIAIMLSGDSSFHAEVLSEVYAQIEKRVLEEPHNWWIVKEVAELYLAVRAKARRARASHAILSPLGLTGETFLSHQKNMDPNLVESITRDMIRYQLPSVSALVVGIDSDSNNRAHPHIFTIDDDEYRCDDVVGFSAIGSGARHAESAFMMAQHNWNAELPATMYLTYTAKKNAEIAPGVGAATDMFAIGPGLGQNLAINAEVLGKLHSEYSQAKAREKRAKEKANAEIKRYVEKLTATPSQDQSTASAGEAGKVAAE